MRDTQKNQPCAYTYNLKPVHLSKPIKNIQLTSYSSSKQSLLALWKYLEFVLKKHFHKDDLVQFFGYYQNASLYQCHLSIQNMNLRKDDFWLLIQKIHEKDIVGKIITLSAVSKEIHQDEERAFELLKTLKHLGYEIRSSNTNNQIKSGEILIPYSFPTLNKRSLQRFTTL